ncbi:MAG: thioredoxin family protein [Ignavibacteriaceae bacterium]
MKLYFIIFLTIIFAVKVNAQEESQTVEENKIIIDDESGKPMLIGYTTREAFSDSSFSWWFDSEYKNYDVDYDAIKPLFEDSTLMENMDITIIMGSWCSDSRREVPRFLKILDVFDFPEEKYTLYNVDRDKHTEADEIDDLNIELVPTFIFYKDDVEIGRITEAPIESLEKDMIKILTGKMDLENN